MMRIIGLTGGIATGKSTVSQLLAQRGYDIIDADSVVRDLQGIGCPLLDRIVNAFGATLLHEDGSLNREKLGHLIFDDEQARGKLEAIVHPAARAEFESRIQQSLADVLFLDVPLLFEAGFDTLTDINLVIYATRQVQLKRLMARNGLSKAAAVARMDSQMDMKKKVALGDFVIDNSGTIGQLEEKVEQFLGEILI